MDFGNEERPFGHAADWGGWVLKLGGAGGAWVVIASQSMGLPVVSFRSGGIPEAVADGETGILVDEKDEAGLAAGVLRLMTETLRPVFPRVRYFIVGGL